MSYDNQDDFQYMLKQLASPFTGDPAQLQAGYEAQQASLPTSNEPQVRVPASPVVPQTPPVLPVANSVPPSPQTKDDDSDQEEPSQRSPSDILAKLQSLKTNPTQNPPPVGDTLSRLLGQSREDMSNAQKQRNSMQLMSMLGQAGSTIGAALTPMANVQPNQAFWSALNKQAEQPVSDVITQKQMNMESLKEHELQGKTDPNSSEAKVVRSLVGQAAKRANIDLSPEELQNASLSTLENISKGIEGMGNRQIQADFLKQKLQEGSESRQAAREAKTTNDQAKAYSDATQKVSSFRGNAGAQQASKDVLSADKALSMLNDPGMKTTQDLQLIAHELGKIASGGVPGEHGVQALMPNNLKTKYAELVNFVSSNPTDAEADAYLKRNKQYLTGMNNVARKTLYDYSTSIAKGFKPRLSSDQYKDLSNDIENKYGAIQQVQAHPQDDEAIKWAKANPNDARSAAILKANGAQ